MSDREMMPTPGPKPVLDFLTPTDLQPLGESLNAPLPLSEEFIYREETPTPDDQPHDQSDFPLADDLAPARDVWENRRPIWSNNTEIDNAIGYFNREVDSQISQAYKSLQDEMIANNIESNRRVKVQLDTKALEARDQTDQIN